VVEEGSFSLLIDPGYGVATALSATGAPRFDEVLVSHGHPDHCADLNPLLRARILAERPPGPLRVHALPAALDAVLALDRPEWLEGAIDLHEFEAGEHFEIGPFAVETALLPHPRPNAGFRIRASRGMLVYTGDCGPSEALVRLAQGADLLLAEASFVDEVPDELRSSLSSADDVGRQAAQAGVQRLVLTHLMPGTNATTALAAAASQFRGRIDVALPGLSIAL